MQGTWLLPSLSRARELEKFFEAYLKAESSTPVMVLVDKEDPEKDEYTKLTYPEKCFLVFTEKRSMGEKVHEVWEQIKDQDWVGILNDDHRPITAQWDQRVLSQINGTNVVFTNDGETPEKPWNFPKRMCGAIAFSGKILRTLGWMFPPGIKHLYSDEVWGALFGRAQCAQGLGDVCVFHDHAYLKPEKRDDTFKLINGEQGLVNGEGTSPLWLDDKRAFQAWLKNDAEKDYRKILELQPKQGVMLATPSHDGNVAMGYAMGLADASVCLAQNNIYFEMARVVGSSLIPHARNSLVDMFLQSKCQRLLMIDSDQGWGKEHLLRLLQSPKLIVAGITPHKRFPINLNFDPLDEDKHYFKDLCNKGPEEFNVFAKEKADPLGLIQVEHVGTGFIMIDRRVFEIMKEHVSEYSAFDNNVDIKHKEYFKMGELDGKYRGEDWWFNTLAKRLNIPIFINANVVVQHTGSYTFAV